MLEMAMFENVFIQLLFVLKFIAYTNKFENVFIQLLISKDMFCFRIVIYLAAIFMKQTYVAQI